MEDMQKDESIVRNNAIDIMKIIASFLVVGVHAGLLEEISPQTAYLINSVFGRMAVPFFACVTGYFLSNHERKNNNAWKRNIKSLLKYYVIFSVIYLAWDFINHNFQGMSCVDFSITIIKRFFIYGTYYHLWFFPCMIAAVTVLHFCIKWKKEKLLWFFSAILYVFGVFTYTWYGVIQGRSWIIDRLMESFDFIYIRRFITAILPFVLLGNYISEREIKKKRTTSFAEKSPCIALFLAIILNGVEIEVATCLGMINGMTGSFGLIFVIYFLFLTLLNHPLDKTGAYKIGKYCRNASVMIYGLHPIILEAIKKRTAFSGTVLWIITIILICVITYILDKGLRNQSKIRGNNKL